jgi:hypothetical protein
MVCTAGDEQSAVPRFPGLCVGCFRRLPLKYIRIIFVFLKHDESVSAAKMHFLVVNKISLCYDDRYIHL